MSRGEEGAGGRRGAQIAEGRRGAQGGAGVRAAMDVRHAGILLIDSVAAQGRGENVIDDLAMVYVVNVGETEPLRRRIATQQMMDPRHR